ncbi:MAG TPA: multicopper oxidase family protein [Candidatus Elarobacter sp.]|nr:multicopper oxidase family protein [Candidatus Elarobacter sp.]
MDYTLVARPRVFQPAQGVRVNALAYNGALPGPVLRVRHGQRVRVRYRNQTDVPTAVHWHGMTLPNAMDGAAGVTQPPVQAGGSFVYEFAPGPPGTRWYHDHGNGSAEMRGLFGMFVVEDPRDAPADVEYAIVLHDVPRVNSIEAARNGVSGAPMVDPLGSPEMRQMRANDRMGDEVAYVAHCINGASYPGTAPLRVKVGQRVRLRVLNANLTQTRYLRLAGHRLHVTHADGNPLQRPIDVDALRIGAAERYDAWFEVRKPGAWLLQGLSSDPLAFEQAVVVHTEGMEHATPDGSAQSIAGVDYFTYEQAAGVGAGAFDASSATVRKHFTLGGGEYGSKRWTMNGAVWPNTEKVIVASGNSVVVGFTNKTDMDHPMHLHGHTFEIVEIDGRSLVRPLAKDVSLVRANGGTMTWRFRADSPPGRWLLHCHNEVHMMDGMMTEVVYR